MKLIVLFLFVSRFIYANEANLTISGYVPHRVDLVVFDQGTRLQLNPELEPNLQIYTKKIASGSKSAINESKISLNRQPSSATLVEPSIIVIEAP